jgi:uncharacterized DUF497 family protein
MAQFQFIKWLVQWFLFKEKIEFDWDEGNLTKNFKKHKINRKSAEQLFFNKEYFFPLGIQTTPQFDEPRFGVLGKDAEGKPLYACFTIRAGKIRIISVRPMSKMERKKYEIFR